MEGILATIKRLLGIDVYCTDFDTDVIVHINSAFMVLNQLGVGPPEGFTITGNTEKWTDFIGTTAGIESVKTYIYLKVKLVFDPPQSSAAMESINRMIRELEWRLNVAVDPAPVVVGEEGTANAE